MSGRDIAVTGIPRGGTTLACQLLGRCRNAMALFEPMKVLSLSPALDAALEETLAYFTSSRQRLLEEGVADSMQRDGEVPDNPIGEAEPDGARRLLATLGTVRPTQPLAPDFTLVIKHNAAFTAMLPALARRLPVLAIVRNPLAVLASWHSVPLPVREGRLPAGERLDRQLAARLEAEPQVLQRQLFILDWFMARFAECLPPAQVLRYEDLVSGHGEPLYVAAGIWPVSTSPLQERNSRLRSPPDVVRQLAIALLEAPGNWRQWYREDEIASLANTTQQGEGG